MFQTFISRHNSNFFSNKLVLTSVTPAFSAPVLQTAKATSSTLYFDSLPVNAGKGGFPHCIQMDACVNAANKVVFFSSRRRHTRGSRDWSSDVCSSDLADARLAADVRLLPDSSVGDDEAAVVTAAVAPLVRESRVNADRVSEALHGETVVVLERRDQAWLRVRAGDGYHAWINAGYVALGTAAWADDWIARATAHSLGAELRCEGTRFRLAIGARAAPRRDGRVETADGRLWDLGAGALRPASEVRAEARPVAAPQWGLRRVSGAPGLWGGRTARGGGWSGLV